MCQLCNMTFAAAEGLISSAAHQSLTTSSASLRSFPRALLLVTSTVTRGFSQATWGDNLESLLLPLLVPVEPCTPSPGTSLLLWGCR